MVVLLVYDGIKVNFVDIFGYVDFVGELWVGLWVVDCVLFVIVVNEGVDELIKFLW